MAAYSSVLAWKIPWAEASGGLQTIGWQRVDHDGNNSMHATERSKKRKRNEKKGPMKGTSSIGRCLKSSEGITGLQSGVCDSAGAWVQRVPKQKHRGHTGGSWHHARSWHSPTEFSRVSGKKAVLRGSTTEPCCPDSEQQLQAGIAAAAVLSSLGSRESGHQAESKGEGEASQGQCPGFPGREIPLHRSKGLGRQGEGALSVKWCLVLTAGSVEGLRLGVKNFLAVSAPRLPHKHGQKIITTASTNWVLTRCQAMSFSFSIYEIMWFLVRYYEIGASFAFHRWKSDTQRGKAAPLGHIKSKWQIWDLI